MSRATLTSINKPHTDNIFSDKESRKKTVEWRTKPLPKGLHYVYETKNKGGCGKVIGEMTIVGWRKFDDVSEIPHETILKGRVGARKLDFYANGRPLYANVIVNAKRYDEPKELGEFYITKKCTSCKDSGYESSACIYDENCLVPVQLTHPPQSWCYVEEI